MTFKDFKEKYQPNLVTEQTNNVQQDVLVSVCIQTYQHEQYIKDCVDSILMQKTDFNYEILLGEDASTDRTREICINYANKYPDKIRLFLHHRENNIKIDNKPTGRFNLLYNLFSSKGKYIALCEGDDYWTDPYKLQKQVNFIEKNLDFSVCGTYCNTQKFSKIETPKNIIYQSYHLIDIIAHNRIPTLTILFRNGVIDYGNLLPHPLGDIGLLLELTKNGERLAKLPFNSAVYRYHGQGANSGNSRFNNLNLQFRTKYQFAKKIKNKKFYFKLKLYFFTMILKELKYLVFNQKFDLNVLELELKFFFKN